MIKFTLRIPEDFHERLTTQAAADRRSLNSELLHLLEVGLAAVAPETPDRPGGDAASPAPLRGKPHSPTPKGAGTLRFTRWIPDEDPAEHAATASAGRVAAERRRS
ncbi:Arc family DNA-binding protein [Streptomyces roseicoloratus]|uniref:Arc family DNA-binding protein n=1 Tax=Streptomyces roseicoloratus TaxID=2508722 RepID=A0ABY9RYI7_9ACTN|nr:Arc family DNA-binding protein [Streptomyces roseicoloratus]WMX47090.1 Arc family DNA-binding protein [Streptomyces roseicoloratus]